MECPSPPPSSASPLLPAASRCRGGEHTHLSEAGRALVMERVFAGDTNAQINAILREEGHLPPGASLSDRALTPYRQSKAVKARREKLTEEAVQSGHAALSASIVTNVEILHAAAYELLNDECSGFRCDDMRRCRVYADLLFKSSEFLWDKMGKDIVDPLGLGEEKRKQAAREAAAKNQAALDAAFRAELVLMVKDDMNRYLRAVIEKKRAEAGESNGEPSGQKAEP